MRRLRSGFRDLLAAGVAALLAVALLVSPAADRVDGLSLDLLFWLRDAAFGPRHLPSRSPTVVVAIDEETYRQPPFRELPNVVWTPQIAAVLQAVLDGGAAVVGFDVIFPTSVARYLPQFDRDFLIALHRGAAENRVVLTRVQHQHKPISPFSAYSFAVGHEQNIRTANLAEDGDGVIRRVPLMFDRHAGDGSRLAEPSFALELAARARGVQVEQDALGRIRIGDDIVPAAPAGGMIVNFDGGASVPTFSLADLFACAEQGRGDYFRAHFAGKAVLIGAVLDVEDRKVTSKRFITAPEGSGLAERCVLAVPAGFYDEARRRDSIPGVYVHAQAINDLLRAEAVHDPGRLRAAAVTFVVVLAVGWATLRLTPAPAAAVSTAGVLVWVALATIAFQRGIALPLLDPPAGGAAAFAGLLGYRFAITDRDKRRLRQAFGLYLAPSVIERMLAEGRMPQLGGETRSVTVLFSDIAGFTGLAEGLPPDRLVAILNGYLAAMTDIIEAHGGFVDKYVGDAIVAMFGAPADDPDHARNAVMAALTCRDRVARLSHELGLPPGRDLSTRIGVNTGEALVGNIGSRRRLNYTAMGDAVNLAARLESANKTYGSVILASDATVNACGDSFAWRQLDRIRVVGRRGAVTVWEPLAPAGALDDEARGRVQRFALALAALRGHRFTEAAEAFAGLAGDPAAALHAQRARAFADAPPPPDWDGVFELETK